MKNYFGTISISNILFLILLNSAILYCQIQEVAKKEDRADYSAVLEMLTRYTEGNKETENNRANDLLNLTKIIGNNVNSFSTDYITHKFLWENESWQDYMKTFIYYDQSGQISETINQIKINGQWRNDTRSYYIYEPPGYLVKEIVNQIFNNNTWENIRKSENSWFTNGTQVIYKNWEGNQWVNDTKRFSVKTGINNYFEDTTYIFKNGKWVWNQVNKQYYSSGEGTICDSSFIYIDEKWAYYKKTIKNNSDGVSVSPTYQWLNNIWVESSRTTQTLGNIGFSEIKVETWSKSGWEKNFKYERRLDTINQYSVTMISWGKDNEWVPNSRSFEYSVNRTPSDEIITQSWINGEWVNYSRSYNINIDVLGIDNLKDSNPSEYKVFQSYPNPFNPSTHIEYCIGENTIVKIKIYDYIGRELETLFNGEQVKGNYSVEWSPKNLPSGVYYYKISAGEFNSIKRMLYLK